MFLFLVVIGIIFFLGNFNVLEVLYNFFILCVFLLYNVFNQVLKVVSLFCVYFVIFIVVLFIVIFLFCSYIVLVGSVLMMCFIWLVIDFESLVGCYFSWW